MKEFTDLDYAYWHTAVQRAVKSGELKAGTDVEEAIVVFRVEIMLENGAEAGTVDKNGNTPCTTQRKTTAKRRGRN